MFLMSREEMLGVLFYLIKNMLSLLFGVNYSKLCYLCLQYLNGVYTARTCWDIILTHYDTEDSSLSPCTWKISEL